jgi:hypothetical protein
MTQISDVTLALIKTGMMIVIWSPVEQAEE